MMRSTLISSVLLWGLGCSDDATRDTGEADPVLGWRVLAEGVGEGVLLAGWEDGEELWVVGGALGAGPGQVGRLSDDGLCLESGVVDRPLWAIHGATEGEWWAVGEEGRVLHYAEGALSRDDVPTEATLFGVWVEDDTVWAVGGQVGIPDSGEIWVRRGDTWSPFATELPRVLFKIWESWVVGELDAYQIAGDGLIPLPTNQRVVTVTGRGPSDVWAVGGSSTPVVLNWTGASWGEVGTADLPPEALAGVWTAPGERVWVAGNRGLVAMLDVDGTWQFPWPRLTEQHLHAVVGFGQEIFFLGGNLFDATDHRGTVVAYSHRDSLDVRTGCDL